MNLGIVILHMDPWRGGVDASLYSLLKEWRKTESITVYYSRLNPAARLEGVRYVQVRGVPIFRLNIEALTASWAWRRMVRRERFACRHDVIYSNHPLLTPCDVMTVHFCISDYLSILRRSPVIGCGSAGVRRVLQYVECRVGAFLERKVYGRMSVEAGPRLHAVSQSVAEGLTSYFPHLQPQVIPNPVDLSRFTTDRDAEERWNQVRRETGWGERCWRHLFVGGGWERKGLADAIESLKYSHQETVLMVIGCGPVRTYRDLATRHGVAGRVYFAGPQVDVEVWHKISDVFVFPSRYESFGIVCIEALASGLPLLCRPFKGTEMFLEDGHNGFAVDSPVSAAERSALMRDDPSRYGELRRKARVTAERFSAPVVAGQMLEFFRGVAAKGRWRG